MLTLRLQTGWGTRAGIGDPTAATAAADSGKTNNAGYVEKLPDTPSYPQQQQYPPQQYAQQPYSPQPQQPYYQQPPVELQTGYAR